jgi:DNA modification methylase
MPSTSHRLINGDARDLFFIEDESVHLVVTSPPIGILNAIMKTPINSGIFRTTKPSSKSWKKFGGMFSGPLFPEAGWSVW